jgi:hypothetical protein
MKSWKQILVAVCACLLLTSCGGSDGLSNLTPLFDSERYLYFNSRGKIVVKPAVKVVETSMFREGLALVAVRTDNGLRYGFMNGKGELAIEAKYLRATVFHEGLAWVVAPGKEPTAIDKSGEVVFSMPDATKVSYFNEGLAAFGRKNPEGETQYGYVDKKGNVVIEPIYWVALHFSNGVAPVMLNEKMGMGYINRKGEMEIAEQFAIALPFSVSGYGRVMSLEHHWGVIDRKGVYVLNPNYEDITIDGADFSVKENGKTGLMDKNGKFIVPPDFKTLMPFYDESFTLASLDGAKYGIIDRTGKFTVDPQFDLGTSFIRGAAVVVSGNYFGIVDVKGKYIVKPHYNKSCSDLVYIRNNRSEYEDVATDYVDMDAVGNQGRGKTPKSDVAIAALKPLNLPATESIMRVTDMYDKYLDRKRITAGDRTALKLDAVKNDFFAKRPNQDFSRGKVVYNGANGRMETVLIIAHDHATWEFLLSYNPNGAYVDCVMIGEIMNYAGDHGEAHIEGNKITYKMIWSDESGDGGESLFVYEITPDLHFVQKKKNK